MGRRLSMGQEAGVTRDGTLGAAIATMVVGVVNEHTGRGPTKSRAYLLDDVVLVVLQDVLTKTERLLVDGGRGDIVRETRRVLHDAMRPMLEAGVARLTGRAVLASFADVRPDSSDAIEAFVLAPATT